MCVCECERGREREKHKVLQDRFCSVFIKEASQCDPHTLIRTHWLSPQHTHKYTHFWMYHWEQKPAGWSLMCVWTVLELHHPGRHPTPLPHNTTIMFLKNLFFRLPVKKKTSITWYLYHVTPDLMLRLHCGAVTGGERRRKQQPNTTPSSSKYVVR